MKRILCMALALMLALPAAALAADLEITQEAFYVTPFLTYYAGKLYVEITNTTDHPMQITGGSYELYDADGATLNSASILVAHPGAIGPGEHAWVAVQASVKDAATPDAIASYSIAVTGKPVDAAAQQYPVSEIQIEDGGLYTRSKQLTAIVTNDTGALIDGNVFMVFGVYDADDRLIYVGEASSMGLGLTAGSSGKMSALFDSEILTQLAAAGTEPAHVEAVATGW